MDSPLKEPQETLYTLRVPAGYYEEQRLDVYITGFMANATRSKVQKGIKEGRVSVNGNIIKRVAHRIQAGDLIVCRINRPPPMEAIPQDIPIDIVYEDEYLLVVNKPAGMVVHPAYGHRDGTLVNALLYHLGSNPLKFDPDAPLLSSDEEIGLSTQYAEPRSADGLDLRPGIVHRLDKDTSGLMVVAKDDVTHSHLAKQFFHRTTRRNYEALVWGHPENKQGRIESYLGRDVRDRKKMATVSEEKGKLAITNYTWFASYGRISHMRFSLETGRTHQIRVHAAELRHPIFGDTVYGGDRIRYGMTTGMSKPFFHNLITRIGRQALHAKTLGFQHPRSHKEMDFDSSLPADIEYTIDRLLKANID